MTEPFRSLLDAAVEDVHPRVAEPAQELILRARAARRRRLAVAGVASAVALTITAGGVVGLGAKERPSEAGSSSTRTTSPEMPKFHAEVVGGEVRIGNLTMPIPQGWQVIRDQKMNFCDIPARAILINVMQIPDTERNCNLVPQIAIRPWSPSPDSIGQGLHEAVVPGGAPLWLVDNDLNNVRESWDGAFSVVEGAVPWSGARITFDMPPGEMEPILRSVRSHGVNASPLALPDGVHKVRLDTSAVTFEERKDAGKHVKGRDDIWKLQDAGGVKSTDPEVVREVIERLKALDRTVAPDELPCAGAEPLVASWSLADSEMAQLTFYDAERKALGSIALSREGGVAVLGRVK